MLLTSDITRVMSSSTRNFIVPWEVWSILQRVILDGWFICRYKLVSTGGTATALEKAGFSVTRVEELTSFPEMVNDYDIILFSFLAFLLSLFL